MYREGDDILKKNILNAIVNLVQTDSYKLKEFYDFHNRANNMGDALEEYIKDIFAGTYLVTNEQERIEKISKVFSYLGNNSNPPDAMLKNGDAIEVKKIENNNASLSLNSSYPKHKLFSDSQMISNSCRDAEDWNEKDVSKEFNFFAIINEERYNEFCKDDRTEFEIFVNNSNINMSKIKIKNPDNPAILNTAYLITYSR